MAKSKFNAFVMLSDVAVYDSYRGLQTYGTITSRSPRITRSTDPAFKWPAWMTFDIGQAASLAVIAGGRPVTAAPGVHVGLWDAANLGYLGRADLPVDEQMPDSNPSSTGGQATPGAGSIWANSMHRPNLRVLPSPQFTSADLAFWQAGFPFNFALSLPKVRYIRFECLTNMGGTNNFFDINEMTSLAIRDRSSSTACHKPLNKLQ